MNGRRSRVGLCAVWASAALAVAWAAGGCVTSGTTGSLQQGGPDAGPALDSGARMQEADDASGGDSASTTDTGPSANDSGTADTGRSDAGAGEGGCGSGGGSGTWSCVQSMSAARVGAGIAVLPNGRALVAGGWNQTDQVLTSAETFDSATGAFTATQSMSSPHLWGAYGQGWPQLSGGKVLVAGGLDATGALESQADVYDPVAGTFSATGPLKTAVISFFPVVLGDGSILFLGGWNSTTGAPPNPSWSYVGSGTNEVQRYSPSTGTFADTGALAEDRLLGCNVVLGNGHVLAIGGTTGQTTTETNIEDYDPTAGTWASVGMLTTPSGCTNAFLLSSGQVLLAGDGSTDGAHLLDPTTYAATATMGFPAGATPAFVQLQNGDVLAMGNAQSGAPSAKTYVYRAATNTWSPTGDMGEARSGFPPPVRLTTGSVLIVGGSDSSGLPTATAELYQP